jgi:hypothetical protein
VDLVETARVQRERPSCILYRTVRTVLYRIQNTVFILDWSRVVVFFIQHLHTILGT